MLLFLAATKQLWGHLCPSVRLSIRPSVCLSHPFHYVPIIVSSWNFQEWLPITEVMSMQKVKVRGQRSRSQRSNPNLAVSCEMMHNAWSCLEEVLYCFWRSSIKFQGHTGQKIAHFDPNWAFPPCYCSLNSQMAMKWCTKLEVAYRRCPIIFQSHPSNFKVMQDKKSPILTRVEHLRAVSPVWIRQWLWNDAQSLT